MATRYAVASGNWSNTATWNGGTLPTSSDDVFSNNFTVTIDGTFTVLSIRNTSNASPVITAGGQFIYANGGSLTCTAAQAIFVPSTTPVLEMNLASPNTATFNGSVLTMASGTGPAIRNSNTGTLNLTGNYNLDGTAGTNRYLIALTSTGTINIVGNVSSTSTGTTGQNNTIYITGTGTVNITGNVTGGGSASSSHSTIVTTVAATINITGNILGNTSGAISLGSSNTLTVIGNVTANSSNAAINNGAFAAIISVTGIITAGSSAPAISGILAGFAAGTFVKISGNVVNTGNIMAVVAPRVTIDTNTSSWLFQISTGGNRTLYAAGVALGNPSTTNVRFGTVYGASSELTGTLIVPSPSNVLQGVGTDATVGTLLMTPADFWNYLISSGFTANSIGDRLQNAATVATTGGQIASYNI
ncbi:hypothetical protein UFOVP299_10 [uncultured Caudovirales phage]|uniref:Uncharacterized protein n=1 Tax=uncultured Caudovirales phage TaxID=2100421 RepID=A0A6J5LSY8_9CAUD|nr:hypothetical protein UFOVP299_10 [uncultured Caudovirales phage]